MVKAKLADGTPIIFYPFMLNKYTGQPQYTGFTEIAEETLKKLRAESNLFKAFEAKKKLIVRTELPASVMSPASVVAQKEAVIAELRTKLAQAEEALKKKGGISQADVDKVVAEAVEKAAAEHTVSVDEAVRELEEKTAALAAAEAQVEALTKVLVDNKIEVPAAKPAQF